MLCVLCLLPLWAAGSIIVFALGLVRCGRMMDPYYDGGGNGGKADHCPLDPHGPRDSRGVHGPGDGGPEGYKADWWPRFERDLGRYVEEQETCPSGHGSAEIEPDRGDTETRTRA